MISQLGILLMDRGSTMTSADHTKDYQRKSHPAQAASIDLNLGEYKIKALIENSA
jgi:hypothetical protein